MKIAIVAPCPVPFIVGGAEKLWWGLARHFNENTPHQADIIKLPAPEADFWSLMDSYQRFSLLRLDGFDLVISGKYPAWMVEHPRHVCYMLHRLRGLYDAYPGPPLGDARSYPPAIRTLLDLLGHNRGRHEILPELFARLMEISSDDEEAKAAFDFPGPLSRVVVHFLDNLALDPARIRRFAAISHTVARRPDYFPAGAEVAVVYPPSNLTVSPGDRYESFFTVSRLDEPKRVGLLIEAMRHVEADVKLLIAGVGPAEERLRALADGDSRISLLGFKSDAELATLYQNALAVPFVPYQEDYGLITVEAMLAAKPVITVKDAGGPTELVRHGENGLSVDATPQALGRAFTQLAEDRQLARTLGKRGRQDAEKITWHAVADILVDSLPKPPFIPAAARRRRNKKLVVVTTFAIHPPRHGGQNRVYHLYRRLAAEFDIVIIALVDQGVPQTRVEIAPGLWELRIAKSREHAAQEARLQEQVPIPIADIAAALYYRHTPALLDAIQQESADATALVACHPYLFPALAEVSAKPVWYEAQDVEFQLKAALMPREGMGAELAARVKRLEQTCCEAAQSILVCAKEDAEILSREFLVDPDKFILTPNGTNCDEIEYKDLPARQALKRRLGCAAQRFVLFMGSGHQPNITATEDIFKLAAALPKIFFVIVGSVCYAFDPALKPENVWLLGEVTEISRKIIMELADIALNPMSGGSGTNLKMLDYFAAGVPVIATDKGARGLDVVDGEHLLIRSVVDMPRALDQLLAQPEYAARLSRSARRHVEEHFDWQVIASRTLADIQRLTHSSP